MLPVQEQPVVFLAQVHDKAQPLLVPHVAHAAVLVVVVTVQPQPHRTLLDLNLALVAVPVVPALLAADLVAATVAQDAVVAHVDEVE